MHTLNIKITYSFRGAPYSESEHTVQIDDATRQRFFPQSSGQAAGWPRAHYDEAVKLVSGLIKAEYFPDEVTPVETIADLRRMGADHVSAVFMVDNVQATIPIIE